MRVLTKSRELREFREDECAGHRVGLVATMGNLHSGHASLIRRSVAECERTIVTIFVNPKQFAAHEDFGRYPRSEGADVKVCSELGASAVFIPSADEMYGAKFDTTVTVGAGDAGRNAASEAHVRPAHFAGVCTVVAKVFAQTRPHVAYFGQKDGQQVATVRRLAEDLFEGTEVRVCETVREADGVAVSSRNAYLSAEARKVGVAVYGALVAGREEFRNGDGGGNADDVRRVVRTVLCEARERAGGVVMDVDYVSVCRRWSMREVVGCGDGEGDGDEEWLLCVAVTIDGTRLLDNVVLERKM